MLAWLVWQVQTTLFSGSDDEVDEEIEALMDNLAGALGHLTQRTDTLIEMVPNVNLHHHANPLEPIIRAFAQRMTGAPGLNDDPSITPESPRDAKGRYLDAKEGKGKE